MSEPEGNGQEEKLSKITRDSQRILAFTALAVSSALVVLVVVGSWFGYHYYQQLSTAERNIASTSHQIQAAKKSTCDFYAVIAAIAVVDKGPQKSGRSLVRLIGDARITYEKRGCGRLSPAGPALTNLSREYGVPVG